MKRKRRYIVLLDGKYYAETWAVSAKKAISNVWWRIQKGGDKFSIAQHELEEFDAIEA